MKIKLSKIYSFLFLMTLFAIPFDGVGIIPFGEFSKEAYILFLLLFIIFYGIFKFKRNLSLPKLSSELQCLLIFIAVLIVSSLVNLHLIFENNHPLRSGLQKLTSQLFVLFFFFPVVTLLFYDFFVKNDSIISKIRKVFVIALYIVFIVGFFETIYIYSRQPFSHNFLETSSKSILNFFDSFPQVNIFLNYWDKRVSSITREPPSLGMFLIIVLPWIISLKPKKKLFWTYYLPLGMILFLAFFSNSRSGLFIVLLQFFSFLILKHTHGLTYKKLLNIVRLTGLLISTLVILFFTFKNTKFVKSRIESYDFVQKYKGNQSNKTRLGTYLSSFEEIKKRPFLGGGFGQAGFYVLNHYPSWAKEDNVEIARYVKGDRFPPTFNIYIRILLETGIIGLLVFLLFLFIMLLKGLLIYYRNKSDIKFFGVIIVLSLIGYSLTWIQFDTFRVLGFWLFFSFYLYVINFQDKIRLKQNGQ